jgi:hypothetical protein
VTGYIAQLDTARDCTLQFIIARAQKHQSLQSRFHFRCFVAACNNISLPLGSRTVPDLSYQLIKLLTATAHNGRTTAVLSSVTATADCSWLYQLGTDRVNKVSSNITAFPCCRENLIISEAVLSSGCFIVAYLVVVS